jgi:Heparinase II/III-like protein/Heparinase II/III N-terminus
MDLEYYSYLARTIPPREIARALTVRAKRALGVPAERVHRRYVWQAANRPSVAAELLALTRGDSEKVLHETREALKGSLPLFGQWRNCGTPVDYHRDPLHPEVVYDASIPGERVDLFVPGADAKAMWEIGRLTHLWRYAQARALTNDREWSLAWSRELERFRATNPKGMGVQWSCAMEVSLRACNIATSYAIVAGEVPAPVEALDEHCDYIAKHLEETGAIRTNHYAADLLGLVVCGALFPELRHWFDAFARRLWDEIPRQVREDGTHFEASIGYQRLCAEMFWLATVAARAAGKPAPPKVEQAVRGLFESLGKVMKPNGDIPQIGDLDSCHALPVVPRSALDAAYLPGVVPARHSAVLKDAGIAVLRANDAYLCLSAGPNGQGGTGGHAHNDKNSVELSFGDDEILVDRGTFVYARDPSERNARRGTAGHSTVQVDAMEQNRIVPGRLFALPDTSHARIVSISAHEGHQTAAGEHRGYARCGVETHRRLVALCERAAVLQDELHGEGEHAIASRLFTPHTKVRQRAASEEEAQRLEALHQHGFSFGFDTQRCVSISDGEGREMALIAFGATAPWTLSLEPTDVSPGYAERRPATRVQLEMFSSIPARIFTAVLRLPRAQRDA